MQELIENGDVLFYNNFANDNIDIWSAINGTIELLDGKLRVTDVAQTGIALKLNDDVWEKVNPGDSYYVEMLLRPISETLIEGKNFGVAINVSSDGKRFFYAGVNGNGRMQAGCDVYMKGYQNSGDGVTYDCNAYHKMRLEINHGVINFYLNDLYMGKGEAEEYLGKELMDYIPQDENGNRLDYHGTIGVYSDGGDFELFSVKVGRLGTNASKLVLQNTENDLPRLWGCYYRGLQTKLFRRVGTEIELTIQAFADDGVTEVGWKAEVNGQAIALKNSEGYSGESLVLRTIAEGQAILKIYNAIDRSNIRIWEFEVRPAFNYIEDNYINLNSRLFPNIGAKNVHVDGELSIAFDETPIKLDDGLIYIYRSFDNQLIDTVEFSSATENIIARTAEYLTSIGDQMARIEGNTLYFTPHFNRFDYDTEYYIAIPNGVITGKINGQPFTGFAAQSKTWYFKTGSAPRNIIDGGIISVDGAPESKAHFRTIQRALRHIQINNLNDVEIQIQPGIYRELLTFAKNCNLTLRGMGTADYGRDVIIRYMNGNVMNGSGNTRSVAFFSTSKTLKLYNLTIHNSGERIKVAQAETLSFNNDHGHLTVENCSFLSEQDTLFTRGYNHFKHCYIEGVMDFIWGYASCCLIEECFVKCLSNGKHSAVIFCSRSPLDQPGYVLFNSVVEMDGVTMYGRNAGGVGHYDNVAILNSTFGGRGLIGQSGWNTEMLPNPLRADVDNGWKEYGNVGESGELLDTSQRAPYSYLLRETEFRKIMSDVRAALAF